MTDKEFKRLNRAQLLDIIYQLQLQVDGLNEENLSLKKSLENKRLRLGNAGSIAEAALEINDCFRSAQKAADQYLSEIKAMREETEAECARLLAVARVEAEKILAGAQSDSAKEAMLRKKQQSQDNNG